METNSLTELKKDELLLYATEVTNKVNASANQLEQLEKFYKENFIDNGSPSKQTLINSLLEGLEQSKKRIDAIRISLDAYINETLIGNSDKQSTKMKIDSLVESIEDTVNSVEQKSEEITNAYELLLVDEAGKDSVQTQIVKIKDNFSQKLIECNSQLEDLKSFHSAVFVKSTNKKGEETEGLKDEVYGLKSQLENLIHATTEKLAALTDHALHNSFANQAERHTKEDAKLETRTFYSVLAISGVTLVFAILQLINIIGFNKPFNYQLMFYQVGISLPLVFIAWMYNRNQKIAKKLAAEYHHKSSLAEAITGYRSLYGLKHDSAEYLALFNDIKGQLNVNPSNKIDKFLNLKSPQEKVVDVGTSALNEDNIKRLAELIKVELPIKKQVNTPAVKTGII